MIEVHGGEVADLRVHTILHGQHVRLRAFLTQPLKERSLQHPLLVLHRQNRAGQLLGIPHQYTLLTSVYQGLQACDLLRLTRLVDHHHRERILRVGQGAAVGGGKGGHDEIGFVDE